MSQPVCMVARFQELPGLGFRELQYFDRSGEAQDKEASICISVKITDV